MKNETIVLAGGSGFMGEELIRFFGKHNKIIVLTRKLPDAVNNRNRYHSLSSKDLANTTYVQWDGKNNGPWGKKLENASLLINLAGKTVNCRYTDANKHEILQSRLDAVRVLGEVVRECKQPPSLWINASSATIYRHATDHAQDEYNGEFHDGFSVSVCRQWEKAFYDQSTPATRKVALRLAINLGTGGVMIPYFNLLKFGLGGKQGSGQQYFSWVHSTDTCRMMEWIFNHPELSGTYNCSAPGAVTNKALMRTLRKVTGNKIGLPAPVWLLKIGAGIIGTETELVLKSRWVRSAKILESGFEFKFTTLEEALTDIIKRVPTKQYRLF